ncbi:MAG TPA: hypothetical protein VMS17_28175 [Gemmataceae bacterium]|nr:hypothetical protein [Gemmataceae bacterium]
MPPDYFAESEVSVGPELEIDEATMQLSRSREPATATATAVWSPPLPKIAAKVDFARLDSYEIRVYRELGGGAEVRAAIELVCPANKDRPGDCLTFAAKCAGHLKHGLGLAVVDVVTSRTANLHAELLHVLEVRGRRTPWTSPTGLYALAYRAVTVRKNPRVEAWPEPLSLGRALPALPLWLSLDLCVPLRLEDSYLAACRSLRIPA